MSEQTESVRYATDVIAVGPLVEDFLGQGMLILFAEGAPEELLEFCAVHRPQITTGGIRAGDRLRVDDHEFEILAVGDRADANLTALGHISLKNNGLRTAPLPGDVCLEAERLPTPREGSRFEIVAGAVAPTGRT